MKVTLPENTKIFHNLLRLLPKGFYKRDNVIPPTTSVIIEGESSDTTINITFKRLPDTVIVDSAPIPVDNDGKFSLQFDIPRESATYRVIAEGTNTHEIFDFSLKNYAIPLYVYEDSFRTLYKILYQTDLQKSYPLPDSSHKIFEELLGFISENESYDVSLSFPAAGGLVTPENLSNFPSNLDYIKQVITYKYSMYQLYILEKFIQTAIDSNFSLYWLPFTWMPARQGVSLWEMTLGATPTITFVEDFTKFLNFGYRLQPPTNVPEIPPEIGYYILNAFANHENKTLDLEWVTIEEAKPGIKFAQGSSPGEVFEYNGKYYIHTAFPVFDWEGILGIGAYSASEITNFPLPVQVAPCLFELKGYDPDIHGGYNYYISGLTLDINIPLYAYAVTATQTYLFPTTEYYHLSVDEKGLSGIDIFLKYYDSANLTFINEEQFKKVRNIILNLQNVFQQINLWTFWIGLWDYDSYSGTYYNITNAQATAGILPGFISPLREPS